MSQDKSKTKPEKDPHPARDNPNEHGEIPRTRDDSDDDKKDPFNDR
ncbi:hypothetical protein [Erwinia persicina]|nr:hypothetical protein [Erwinia persicina]MBD8161693.1 hypothetical protein [Erwinia persicina]MBD8212864.1 hypothetical protein [Erwinia persicina]